MARTIPYRNSVSKTRQSRAGEEIRLGRIVASLCLMALPLAAAEYKIAVVSMLHAHVWLHLGTMLRSDTVKLVGVSETLPELIKRAKREDVIPQTQGVTRPGVPDSLIFA